MNLPERILELAQGFQKSRILLSAVELDIFSFLREQSKTSEQVAAELKINPKATDRLMNALVGLELLVKEDQKFSNSEMAQKFLVRQSPEFLSGMGHSSAMYKSWATLTDAVRLGTSVIKEEKNPKELENFIEAMNRRALPQAEHIAALLDLNGVKRILDIGGGSGVFSMAFCRKQPSARATVLDLPAVTPLTQKYIQKANMSDKVDVLNGNYLETRFPSGNDLVFMSAIVHINSYSENMKLIKKAYDSLNSGGQIVIQDWVMEENRVYPTQGSIFALNMLVNTERGDTYTEQEMQQWLKSAGCEKIEKKETGLTTNLMIGYKN